MRFLIGVSAAAVAIAATVFVVRFYLTLYWAADYLHTHDVEPIRDNLRLAGIWYLWFLLAAFIWAAIIHFRDKHSSAVS